MKLNKLTLVFSFAILITLSFASCGDDDDNSGGGDVDCNSSASVDNAILDEAEAVSNALGAYSSDQSAANCNALEDAYEDYIDALKKFQDCANDAGIGAQFESLVSSTEASLLNLGC